MTTQAAGAAGVHTPKRIWLMFGVAVVAAAAMASPYVLLDPATSRIATTSPLPYGLLVAHIATATVALVLGPLQFVPRIRARRSVHRALGRTYLLAGVLPSALVGIPLAILSGRLVTQVGLTVAFVAWLVTAALAVRAIRRGDVAAHRAWMTRNYALTFLAVTARLLVPLMLVAQIPVVGTAGLAASVPSLIPIGQVLGWVVNLAVVEVVLRRARFSRGPRPAAP